MQTVDFPWDLQKLAERRAKWFLRGAEAARDGLDPIVVDSWKRCLQRGLSPEKVSLLAQREQFRDKDLSIQNLARPILEDLYQFGERPQGAFVVLSAEGVILDVVGTPQFLERWSDLGVAEGGVWREEVLGTNGFALALIEAFPVLVVGPEHYCHALWELWTAGAPFFDLEGKVSGVIGALGCAETAHPHSLAMLMSAARWLELQVQAEHFVVEANRRYTELQGAFEAIGDGILIWRRDGVILHGNSAVQRVLHVPLRQLLGKKVQQIFRFSESVYQALQEGSEWEGETLWAVFGRTIRCWLELRALREGEETIGFVAVLRPLERLQQWTRRMMGAEALVSLEKVPGTSSSMKRVWAQARRAAQGRAPILLVGESGVGKNPLARAIHQAGPYAKGPFVAVNCFAIPKELMLVEFLGYEGGAFQGASSEGRPGKFELAHEGTLFLESIEGLPLEMQKVLLQVMDSGMVMRLGGTRGIPVHFRLIGATTEDLTALAAEGRFRADLLHRFSAFTIRIPPLRERKEEIPLLVERILQEYNVALRRSLRITPEAMERLVRYPWPGNVRELEHVMERIVYEARGDEIRVEDLPPSLRLEQHVLVEGRLLPVMSLAEAEREAILRAARATRGRVGEMAKLLGISRTTLWRRLRTYDIDLSAFRKS